MAKVVLIDDSRMMRRFIRHQLEEAGHEVEEWVKILHMPLDPNTLQEALRLLL